MRGDTFFWWIAIICWGLLLLFEVIPLLTGEKATAERLDYYKAAHGTQPERETEPPIWENW